MNKQKIISIALGTLILTYLIKISKIDTNIIYSIQNPAYIILAAIVTTTYFPVSALRMNYFLKSIDNRSYSIKTLTKIEFISKYIYYITPSKLYLPAKAILLNQLCSIRKSTSLAIISFEYAIDTVITITIALLGAIFLFRETLNISADKLSLLLITIMAFTLLFISTPERYIGYLSARTDSRLNNKYLKKIVVNTINIIRTTRNTWLELLLNKKMRYIIPITIIQILITVSSTKLLFLSMATDIPILWIIAVSAAAIFVGGISQIPGGLGVREGTGIALYYILGIPKEITIVVVLINRLYTIIPLILGYWYSINSNIKWRT